MRVLEFLKSVKSKRDTVRQLEALSDRELWDIGLTRYDIHNAALVKWYNC